MSTETRAVFDEIKTVSPEQRREILESLLQADDTGRDDGGSISTEARQGNEGFGFFVGTTAPVRTTAVEPKAAKRTTASFAWLQLAENESWDSLLRGYPELTRADIQAVLEYARPSILHTEISDLSAA